MSKSPDRRRSFGEAIAAQSIEEWVATLFFVFVLVVIPIIVVFGR